MVDTTDIEKKSLEAHVELCSERYRFLEQKLLSVEEKVSTVISSVSTVKSTIEIMSTKNNDRLISWGLGIIVTLVGSCAYLIMHFVVK